MFLMADPAAGQLESFLDPELGTLGTTASIPSRRMPLEAEEHDSPEDRTYPEDNRPKNKPERPDQTS
jgi:hypothetical protein